MTALPAPVSRPENRSLTFDRFELLPAQRELRCAGQPVRLGSRAFDLLCLLAANPGAWLGAEALRAGVWGTADVDPNNLRVQISALRKTLGSGAIENRPGLGWRLAWAVVEQGVDPIESLAKRSSPGNLPATASALLGRDAEMARLLAALGRNRVTLLGTAGVGKTTLAIAAAGRVQADFPDGVWIVPLASVQRDGHLLGAVATAIGVTLPAEAEWRHVARALSGRRVLLVLDNCEHLVAAVKALADALLHGAPSVSVLATSRRALQFAGEHIEAVAGLALPPDDTLASARRSGAVMVFEARARIADPRFALTAGNAAAVIALCRRFDGLALALVLAASRLPLLGLQGLHAALVARPDGGGMKVLSNGSADDAGGRHVSLEAALDWSHGLLDADVQRVFRRLGVFAGSFGLRSVLAICADESLDAWAVTEAVDELIRQCLVMNDPAALLDGRIEQRYTLHQSALLYARARLESDEDADVVRRRHALHFAALTEGEQTGPGPHRMLEDASLPDADHDNLRLALDWSIRADPLLALRLAGAAGRFWRLRGWHAEALRYAELVLGLAPCRAADQAPLRNKLRLVVCGSAYEHGRIDVLSDFANEALVESRREGHARGVSLALFWTATARHGRGDVEGGLADYGAAAAASRSVDDEVGLAHALINLGRLSIEVERFAEARRWLREALGLYERIRLHDGAVIAHHNLGDLAFAESDDREAEIEWLLALAGYTAKNHRWPMAVLQQQLAVVAARHGRFDHARAGLRECVAACQRHGFEATLADCLGARAALVLAETNSRGQTDRQANASARLVVSLLASAEIARRRVGSGRVHVAVLIEQRTTASIRSALDASGWQAAWSRGLRWTPTQALQAADAEQGAGDRRSRN